MKEKQKYVTAADYTRQTDARETKMTEIINEGSKTIK